jgi:hypothetical protein
VPLSLRGFDGVCASSMNGERAERKHTPYKGTELK